MKRVLVTGGTGFIGRHCLPLLKQRGFEVFAVSSKPQVSRDGIHWLEWDLLNCLSLKESIASIAPTHLLHLAWDVIPGKIWTSTANLNWLKASIDLLEAFSFRGGKRVVMAGTCAEYDWTKTDFSETSPLAFDHVLSLYGSCKLALHRVLESLARQSGFSQAWGRIFHLYGPHEHPQRFIPSILKGLLEKKQVLCSHGNQIRDFLYVEDVAEAFVSLLESDLQGAVNVGSGEGISLKSVIEKITDRLGEKELVCLGALPAPSLDPAFLVANTSRLTKELNWKPRYTLETGLEKTIEWWKGNIN